MTISTDRSGTGAPSLIFVHGGACDRTDWSLQMAALSLHFEVITLDLPGHGESAPPEDNSIDALAHSVVEVKNTVAGPCILIGHSMGCRVILQAYGDSPEGITGLIFVDGSLAAGQGDEAAAEMAAAKIKAMGVEAFLEYSFAQMFIPTSSPALRDRIVTRAKCWDPRLTAMLLIDTIRWDARNTTKSLTDVKIPVMMLQSSHVDETFARRSLLPGMSTPWTELVTRLIPRAKLLIIEGAGHFPHIEAAPAVNAGIERFARESQ